LAKVNSKYGSKSMIRVMNPKEMIANDFANVCGKCVLEQEGAEGRGQGVLGWNGYNSWNCKGNPLFFTEAVRNVSFSYFSIQS
jgi:hypothetical protein